MQVVEVRSGRHINRQRKTEEQYRGDVEARIAGGTTNNKTKRHLQGFIVSDSEEESSSEEEEEEELPLEERLGHRRGGGGGGGGARKLQRLRHDRSVRDALDSDFEEEEEPYLDSPAAVAKAVEREGGWKRVRRQNINNTGTTNTFRNNNMRNKNTASRQQRQQQQESIQDDDVPSATIAQHAIEVLTDNWDSLRRGKRSSNQLLAQDCGNNINKNIKSRQGREAARARLAAKNEAEDVIDLSESPAAAPPAAGITAITTKPGGLSPPIGITSLSFKLRAELSACREKGARLPPRKHSTGNGGGGGSGANNNNRAPALLNNSATPHASGSWRRTNNLGSPGSGGPHRMRTLRDVNRSAEVARRTPDSTGADGRKKPPAPPVKATPVFQRLGTGTYSSPAPLQQRLAARAAAEWGTNTTHGGSGSGNINNGWRQVKRPEPLEKSSTYYPQQRQQQDIQQYNRPRWETDPDPAPHSSTSSKRQRQQQQQRPGGEIRENIPK